MPGRIDALRGMDWMTAPRARGWRNTLLAVLLSAALALVLTARAGTDVMGKPLGTDFLAFWSASRLALEGQGAAAYDLARIYAVERVSVPVDPGPSSFLYPPPFLLLCLPLALAPYFVALTGWLAATGAAWLLMVWRWLRVQPDAARGAMLTILAFPAVAINAGHGQNGFLTAGLLGGGLWLIDRRPWLAGVLLGLLVVKPQIALAVPVLVLAGGHGRIALAGTATAAAACLASWLVFGSSVWAGFFAGSDTGRAILEAGLVEPGKMVSVFAMVRTWGGAAGIAYAVQGAVAAGVVLMLAMVVRRGGVVPGGAALCAAATPLISPFFLDYDLAILAVPLAWLYTEGVRRGFRPWEKAVLVAGYALPLIARPLALLLGMPIGPWVLLALFLVCARAADGRGQAGRDAERPAIRAPGAKTPW